MYCIRFVSQEDTRFFRRRCLSCLIRGLGKIVCGISVFGYTVGKDWFAALRYTAYSIDERLLL